jgi:hypothetical protein
VRSLIKLALAWLVATAAAVGLGVLAVGVVTDSVTEDRPDRLSAIAVRHALSVPPTPTTASTAPRAPAAEDRTYQLVGGTVGVRFENAGARLLWATPKPGFRVESSGSSDNVDVRFRRDDHESRLKAFWDNGPQSEVEERDG